MLSAAMICYLPRFSSCASGLATGPYRPERIKGNWFRVNMNKSKIVSAFLWKVTYAMLSDNSEHILWLCDSCGSNVMDVSVVFPIAEGWLYRNKGEVIIHGIERIDRQEVNSCIALQ